MHVVISYKMKKMKNKSKVVLNNANPQYSKSQKYQPTLTVLPKCTLNTNTNSSISKNNPLIKAEADFKNEKRWGNNQQESITIVNTYYENNEKLTAYYLQIESLIDYNKRLLGILNLFEEQEDKLIKRLTKIEEMNLEYMREYCIVMGREFKPSLPQYKSIFSNFNLLDITINCNLPEPPRIDLNYKQELLAILNDNFLTRQDHLYMAINQELQHLQQEKNVPVEDIRELTKLQNMVEHYNQEYDQRREETVFDLLKFFSQIRNKAQQYYDRKASKTPIRPSPTSNLTQQLIHLHSMTQQFSEQSLKQCICQLKNVQSRMQDLRMDYQQLTETYTKVVQESEQYAKDIGENKKIIKELRENNDKCIREMGEQINKSQLELLAKNQELAQIQICLDSCQGINRQIREELLLKSQEVDKKNQVIQNLQQISQEKEQKKTQTQKRLSQCLTQLETIQESLTTLTEKLKTLELEKEQLSQQLKIQLEHGNKLEKNQVFVEGLAIEVYRALDLVSSLNFNDKIKNRLDSIKAKLKIFLDEYEKQNQWDFINEKPNFFKQFSLNNEPIASNASSIETPEKKNRQNLGYSFDLQNLQLVRQAINRNIKQQQQPQVHSMIHEKNPFNHDMSLQFSNQNEDYQTLRTLYDQAMQCLTMEQKKSKTMELEYQRYVEMILNKQKKDNENYSLEKQVVFLTRLTHEQKQTIEEERKHYNEIFKNSMQSFKDQMNEKMANLRTLVSSSTK